MAGADYQHIFKLNSNIENFYLATQNIQCRIIGFLDKNTRVKIDGESINLDNCLIVPDIKLSAQDKTDFKQTLLSVKCNGYLHYENKKEYHQMAQEIKKIVIHRTDFFDLPFICFRFAADLKKIIQGTIYQDWKKFVGYYIQESCCLSGIPVFSFCDQSESPFSSL